MIHVPLLVNRFQKSGSLIVQYKYLKSCSEDFILQNLILRTRSCGTGFITKPSWLLHFQPTKMVGRKCFVPVRYQLRRGISGGPALKYFCMIYRVGRAMRGVSDSVGRRNVLLSMWCLELRVQDTGILVTTYTAFFWQLVVSWRSQVCWRGERECVSEKECRIRDGRWSGRESFAERDRLGEYAREVESRGEGAGTRESERSSQRALEKEITVFNRQVEERYVQFKRVCLMAKLKRMEDG